MFNFFKNLLSREPKVGKVDIGKRFQLITRVGIGSMSKVWRAIDLRTSQTVCLKILDFEKTIRFESRFNNFKTRKPSEGEIAYTLRHPNIVQTLDFGITTDNEYFIVMEFVDGTPLSYLVDTQNAVMRANRHRFILELGDALVYFHSQNWIHRDLCPRNVVVDESLTIKLIDFGLAVPNIPEYQAPGNRTGTAMYMAPELIKRQRTDQRIDVFAFACTCFEMYARQLPWPNAETLEAVVQRINLPPKDIRDLVPEIHPRVGKTIMRGLHQDPNKRWQSIAQMMEPLKRSFAELEANEIG